MSHHSTTASSHDRLCVNCRQGMTLLALICFCIVILAGCSNVLTASETMKAAAPSPSPSTGSSSLQEDVINVIRTAQPSVVEVRSQGSQGEAIGSGDILTSDGYIVTNDHVVRGFDSFSVRFANDQVASAKLVGQDAQDDLAVLKVNVNRLRPISLGDSSRVQVGEFAIALGSPLGLEETATFGIISAVNRAASEGANGPASTLVGLIQTSAPINPGNSGGALVNLQTQLIGVPTLAAVDPQIGAPANGIGFAIPSNRVKFVAQQLIQHGKLLHSGQGFLGVQGQDVTPELAAARGLATQSGVLVVGFANDAAGQSPAQHVGVKVNDVITAVSGQTIASSDDLAALTLGQKPGTQVSLAVVRNGKQLTTPVKLGERPVSS